MPQLSLQSYSRGIVTGSKAPRQLLWKLSILEKFEYSSRSASIRNPKVSVDQEWLLSKVDLPTHWPEKAGNHFQKVGAKDFQAWLFWLYRFGIAKVNFATIVDSSWLKILLLKFLLKILKKPITALGSAHQRSNPHWSEGILSRPGNCLFASQATVNSSNNRWRQEIRLRWSAVLSQIDSMQMRKLQSRIKRSAAKSGKYFQQQSLLLRIHHPSQK